MAVPAGSGSSQPARSRDWQASVRVWLRRLGFVLVIILSLGGYLLALSQLVLSQRPVRVEHVLLGDIPVTVFQGDGEPGPAVVIAHGFAGSRQLMYPFALTLARNGYTTFAFDFPGHGQNTVPLQGDFRDRETRYTQLLNAIDLVVAFARTRVEGPVGLVGHSMGSEAVARYAQAHPDRVAAVAAISMVYEGITPDSPANLLLVTGGLEFQLRPRTLHAVDQAVVGGLGQPGVTYGEFAEGTARRAVFAPGVEHIGVLYSPVSMRETLNWMNQAFGRSVPASPYLDNRGPWLGLLYLSALVLFWPFSFLIEHHKPLPDRTAGFATFTWIWWAGLAVIPAVLAPLLLWGLQALLPRPIDTWLLIQVADPLTLHFAIYGLLTGLGLLLWWLVWRRRTRRAGQPPAEPPPVSSAGRTTVVHHPEEPTAHRSEGPAPLKRVRQLRWQQVRWQQAAIPVAIALLIVGYVFLLIGVPTHFFVLNFFPPVERLGFVALFFVGMLLYFLADERLTRGVGRPWGIYAITKVCLIGSLVLTMFFIPTLFFVVLIAPLLVAYFIIYGLMSWRLYRRTGTIAPGTLTNAVFFAWIIAVTFPLVA